MAIKPIKLCNLNDVAAARAFLTRRLPESLFLLESLDITCSEQQEPRFDFFVLQDDDDNDDDDGVIGVFCKHKLADVDTYLAFVVERPHSMLSKALMQPPLSMSSTDELIMHAIPDNETQLKALDLLRGSTHKLETYEFGFYLWWLKDISKFRRRSVSDAEVIRLEPEHAETVDAFWPYAYPGSVERIQRCIRHGSKGVVLKNSGKLVAWVLRQDQGCIGMLHVLEEARGKGYGAAVVSALCDDILAEGRQCFAFIRTDNQASTSLFQSLGFEATTKHNWHKIKLINN